MAAAPTPALLDGVRVLDLGIWRPVPYATQLLVEMGADVIKVEPPGGDPMRVFPDLFAVLNAGKRAVAADLKDASERAAVLALAGESDVVIEGFRPGVAARLGVGPGEVHARNAAVVYCSVSGYGQTGPMRDLPGHDLNYQALGGVLEPRSPDGEPVVGRPPVADLAAGAYAAMAICAALARAARSGRGEYIDVAMADILATWTGPLPSLQVDGGPVLAGGVPGYGTFRAADGAWLALGVLDEQPLWDALVTALELPEHAGKTFTARLAEMDALNAAIAERVAARPRAELLDVLGRAGAAVSPVLGQGDLADDPQLTARGVVRRSADGRVTMSHPVQYHHHPARVPQAVPPLTSGRAGFPQWHARDTHDEGTRS